jgi:hypothetical protein
MESLRKSELEGDDAKRFQRVTKVACQVGPFVHD